MPARPVLLDELGQKMLDADWRGLAFPICCFKTCKAAGTVILTLSYRDGHAELYSLCQRHAAALREHNPTAPIDVGQQTTFSLRAP